MNLVAFSIKTKGIHNFVRRLWTVFTRFSFSEVRTYRALHTIVDVLREFNTSPTFFIPAIVLNRHAGLIRELVTCNAEIGIHGYVHNDYRFLSHSEQYKQTERAISVFQKTLVPFHGFRNPYLGWTNESLQVYASLGFTYESNAAVLHEVLNLDEFSPLLRSGYEKSLTLFQAVPCNSYAVRPHFGVEGTLLQIPTSIPDDEMLFDRLRIVNPNEVGRIWSEIMQRVYDLGGIYILNLHPERAVSCKQALAILLANARKKELPVWMTTLRDAALWWRERSKFRLYITPISDDVWNVESSCSSRATVLVRHLDVENVECTPWFGSDFSVPEHSFQVHAKKCPCIGVTTRTSEQIIEFLHEQGYPTIRCSEDEEDTYAYYVDMPEGFASSPTKQVLQKNALVEQIEQLEMPFIHFGCWPDTCRAALGISGDIDSVTIQDFFLRIFEVKRRI